MIILPVASTIKTAVGAFVLLKNPNTQNKYLKSCKEFYEKNHMHRTNHEGDYHGQ